jgi:hypothetical protein
MANAFLALPGRHLESDRAFQGVGERLRVPLRGPELELRIADGAKPDDQSVFLLPDMDRANRLRVAAVEPLGQPDDAGQQFHRAPERRRQCRVVLL